MNWLNELELVRLLRTVMVSIDETWDIADIHFGALMFIELLCGFNVISYCMDIFQLVKRKAMAETMIGMLLPGMAAVFGAVWLTEYGSLPSGQVLARLAEQPFSLELSAELAASAGVFAAVFALTRLCRRKNGQEEGVEAGKGGRAETGGEAGKGERAETGGQIKGVRMKKAEWRWIASYAIDFAAAFMAFAAGCYGLITNLALNEGRNPFAGRPGLYGVFLYLLPFMLFKTVLLLIFLLLQVYGAKITLFPYRQGMHAGRYLYRWLLLYHSPLLREVLVFLLVAGLFLARAAGNILREDALLGAAVFGILGAGYLWAALVRSTAPLRKFRGWGAECDAGRLKERFCQEYFCQEPLFRNGEYTLTRSFLVEENNSAGIFYLGSLRYLPRGWIQDGKGWRRDLIFRDQSKVSLEKGKQGSEEIFRYISQYAKSYGIAESNAMAEGVRKGQKEYNAIIKGRLLAVWTVAMMLILTVLLMDGLGFWG